MQRQRAHNRSDFEAGFGSSWRLLSLLEAQVRSLCAACRVYQLGQLVQNTGGSTVDAAQALRKASMLDYVRKHRLGWLSEAGRVQSVSARAAYPWEDQCLMVKADRFSQSATVK